MTIVVILLVLALFGALVALVAASVTRHAAADRVAAGVRVLDADATGVEEYARPSLDDALDALERAVGAESSRRARATEAENRLSWALGAIANGVVIFDDRGQIVYRNDPAASFLAARHSDALVEEAITSMAADALRGRAAERELELFGPPRRVLSVRAAPLENASRPSGVLVVVEDTSERRRLENVRRDFVANISHELKTPVGALALLAETLLDEDDPAVAQRLVERLANEAFRVGHTIDDLLELSRLEVATGLASDSVSVAGFINAAADRVRPAAEQRAIEIEVEELPGRLTVIGDRRQLVSAVTNLLDNAVKYSEPGSAVERPGPHRRQLGRRHRAGPRDRHPRAATSSASSSASTGSTAPAAARPAAPVSAWPSSATSPRTTGRGTGRVTRGRGLDVHSAAPAPAAGPAAVTKEAG